MHVVAGTTSSKTVSFVQIYVDGVKKTEVNGSTIDTNVSLPAGTHKLTVQAYNGAYFKSTENITVTGTSSSCTLNTADPSVTICTPAPNATVTSPVHVVADTTSSKAVTFVQIYLDNVKATEVKGSKIDTSLSMSAGTHRLTVQASNGTIFKSTENITVSGSGGGGGGNLTGVLTYKNDNNRLGLNDQEAVLTPANVKSSTFGKKFSYTVDGYVFAQPLYVKDLTINGAAHNVLFIATEHDSVYAFDADGQTLSPLWKRSFIDSANGIVPVAACQSCGRTALGPEVGVTGTPVIDINTQTLYVSAMTNENGTIMHKLHALDITSGAEKFGGPVQMTASVPGKGAGTDGLGNVPFVSDTANQRSGLLLVNGVVYVTWAAFSDVEPYHGWMMAYDATSLQQLAVFNATPDTSAGGIWAGGCAPAADANGNVFAMTGNGHFDQAGKEYGQTFLKLALVNGQLQVVDFFTPYNWQTINSTDLDIGSGCPALLPPQTGTSHPDLLVSGTKDGKIYLIDRDNMGKFQSGSNSQIPQTINLNPANVTSGTRPRMYSSPAFFNGHVYVVPANMNLRSYTLANSKLTLSSQSSVTFTTRGAIPVISASGNGNGIVWVADRNVNTGNLTLRAWNATNVTSQIYNSAQNSTRDSIGAGGAFAVPTVANGRVYVGGKGKVTVFGLL